MSVPFSDITFYVGPGKVGLPEYNMNISLINYVCDWYVQQMKEYKPPRVTRVCISPSFHGIWSKPMRFGSIVNVAPRFDNDYFELLEKAEKYKYVLDVIQEAMLLGTEEFGWDRSVFEIAYQNILDSNFQFILTYPSKISLNRSITAVFIVEKTDTITSAFVEIRYQGKNIKAKLFDKKNSWCYDCIYYLGSTSKWFDSDRFGFQHEKTKIAAWYSIDTGLISLYEGDIKVDTIDFSKYFLFQ